MTYKFLSLDLQYFSENEEAPAPQVADIEDFDLDAFDARYEEELEESEEFSEPSEDPEVPEDSEPDEGDQAEAPPIHDEDAEKRNAAFADMRRKAEENEKYAQVILGLAQKHGMTPEEVIQQYEDSQLEQEAENQDVPVDVLKRLRSLESENQEAKKEAFLTRFQSQIDSTMQKYGASEEEVRKTFEFAIQNGIDFENMPVTFEAAYKLAHHDALTEKAVKEAVQKELSAKKKRQRDAGIPNGAGSSQSTEDDVLDQATRDARSIVADWY